MEMKTPLVSRDENGPHVHRGHRLVPTGVGYKTLPKAISQMTDDELAAFITEKGNQIHQIERQRDYLRVAQSTAKLEKGEREIAAMRALRGIKLPPGVLAPSNKGIKITGNAGGKGANGAIKGISGPAGVDLAAFLKFATDAMAKKKASPSAPKAVVTATTTPQAQAPANAVTAKKGGEMVDGPVSPPPISKEASLEEQAREAEIEAILDEDIPF